MREVFEAFLTDPVRIDEGVFALWLEGRHASDALSARLPSALEMPAIGDRDKLRELLWRDTVDQYRLFDKLEHYLMQPSLFRSQLLFQIPPIQQHFMIERYYALDGAVARWLVGKKLTIKLQKDLDEISERAQRTLKSCRRQLDNLCRVWSAMEDRNFQGISCQAVRGQFSISDKLACKYACVLFVLHARFEVHPTQPATGGLSWHELLFLTTTIMVHWIPQRRQSPLLVRARSQPTGAHDSSASTTTTTTTTTTAVASPAPSTLLPPPPVLIPQLVVCPVENAADLCLRCSEGGEWPSLQLLQDKLVPTSVKGTIGLDLSMNLTNCLRDLKAHLINDSEMLAVYRQHIMGRLTAIYGPEEMHELSLKLYLIVHGFLALGAGLSQPKEFKDFFGNLVTMVIRVLKDCNVQYVQLDDVFSALIDSLAKLDVWYLTGEETRGALLASWERFLSVCRVIISVMYEKVDTSQL